MAKTNYTLKFTNAYVDVSNNTITEVTKDATFTHDLKEVLEQLEGKQLDITFSEKNDVFPEEQ